MKKAYGYIRVSGKGQVGGDGFTRQEKAIKDYAKANGITIDHIYREKGVSGTLSDLMIQETILDDMKKKAVEIISVTDGDLLEDDPTRKLVRQVLGAIAEYDKEMTVQKLRAARNRKRALNGKCEGRKSYLETNTQLIAEIKRLRRKPKNGKRLSLQKTVDALNAAGYKTATGLEFTLPIIKNIIFKTMKKG